LIARHQDAFQKCRLQTNGRKGVVVPGSQVADCDGNVTETLKNVEKIEGPVVRFPVPRYFVLKIVFANMDRTLPKPKTTGVGPSTTRFESAYGSHLIGGHSSKHKAAKGTFAALPFSHDPHPSPKVIYFSLKRATSEEPSSVVMVTW
jgi:hypothetical protein